jgi:hypothetical protein
MNTASSNHHHKNQQELLYKMSFNFLCNDVDSNDDHHQNQPDPDPESPREKIGDHDQIHYHNLSELKYFKLDATTTKLRKKKRRRRSLEETTLIFHSFTTSDNGTPDWISLQNPYDSLHATMSWKLNNKKKPLNENKKNPIQCKRLKVESDIKKIEIIE